MTTPVKKIRIDAVLESKHHAVESGGRGFGELLFSITNTGDPLRTSEVSMALAFPGQAGLLPLPFPAGVKTLEPNHSIDFSAVPGTLRRGSGAAIVLMWTADGSEISRAPIRDLPPCCRQGARPDDACASKREIAVPGEHLWGKPVRGKK